MQTGSAAGQLAREGDIAGSISGPIHSPGRYRAGLLFTMNEHEWKAAHAKICGEMGWTISSDDLEAVWREYGQPGDDYMSPQEAFDYELSCL